MIKIVAFILFVGCVSTPKVDTYLEARQVSANTSVGIRSGKIVQQDSAPLAEEIQVTRNVNENIILDLRSEVWTLKDCLKKQSKKTHREFPRISFDEFEISLNSSEEYGQDTDGVVRVVKREDAVARLKAERDLQKTLRRQLSLAKELREKCEFQEGTI